jgi:hypothetical protein
MVVGEACVFNPGPRIHFDGRQGGKLRFAALSDSVRLKSRVSNEETLSDTHCLSLSYSFALSLSLSLIQVYPDRQRSLLFLEA